MIKVGLIGAGKMGLSHLAILGAHPDVEIIGVVDYSKMICDVLDKYSSFDTYKDYQQMLNEKNPDAVIVAVPTKNHASIVEELIQRRIHVFVEKPFCLNTQQGSLLVKLAKQKNIVNQVGYHNKFIGTFEEAKKIISKGFIGSIHHFEGESYGPVVVKKTQNTWRSKADEGGGCLLDYASHVIDLLNYLVDPIENIKGSLIKNIYSTNVEDAVYSLLETKHKITGVLSVNWSEDTYRKMSTSITINGSDGKMIVDATELKVYFKNKNTPSGYTKGWNVKYITDFDKKINYYLRGEEYTLQLDYFINSIKGNVPNNINNFESALLTDTIISKIKNNYKIHEQNSIWG
jgi:predicted dehydrogenase